MFNDAKLADREDKIHIVCGDLGAESVEFNGEPDHAHLLVSHPPTLAISTIAKQLQGTTARRMRAEYTDLFNRAQMHGHFWTPSYVAVPAGGASLSIIKQYTENQARPL